MNKSRRLLLAGVGAMTPAFMLAGGAAKARTAEPAAMRHVQDALLATEQDMAALKQGLLALSPGEKLRIPGDRIRLAQKQTGTGTPKFNQPSAPKFNKPAGATKPARASRLVAAKGQHFKKVQLQVRRRK
jgi:hypothetical protein